MRRGGREGSPLDEDGTLVATALGGEAAAFGELVRRHQGPVRAVLRAHVGSAGPVEDLAQDVFLRGWRALRTWRASRGSLRTWLLTIARNCARDHLRRGRVRGTQIALASEPHAVVSASAQIPRGLDAALAALSTEQRVAFLLSDVHGVTPTEIAAIEGVPLGTIKSRLDRARKRLRAALSEAEDE